MGDSVDNGFKHRTHRILRDVDPCRNLYRANAHIALDELARLLDLDVQRSRYVTRVKLVIRIALNAAIADCLYECAWKMHFRPFRCDQNSCNRRTQSPIRVRRNEMKLPKEFTIVIRRQSRAQPRIKRRNQLIHLGVNHNLLVKADKPRLATLLKQAGQHLR